MCQFWFQYVNHTDYIIICLSFITGLLEHKFKIENDHSIKNYFLYFSQVVHAYYVPEKTWNIETMKYVFYSQYTFCKN